MKNKIIGIIVCMMMISCSTMTLALTPFSRDAQQMKHRFFDSTPVPLPPSMGWMKTFGGTDRDEGFYAQQTTDGGYIIIGDRDYHGDVWLIKTNSNGDETWNRIFGGIGSDEGLFVQQTTDGGYIITGSTASYGAGTDDVWLIKTDTNGYETWNRTFGGRGSDIGWSVEQTTDRGYIITGWTYSFGAGDADMWLIKTDTNGYETWNKTFGETNKDWSYSGQQTNDGGYIMAGYTDAWGAYTLARLIKTDDVGNKIWEKNFGKTNYDNYCFSVQQTRDEGYILTGEVGFTANVWLIKTDSNGDETWNRTFGGTNHAWGNFVQQTTDEGYIITGNKNSFRTGNDIWLIKTDSSGIMIWDKTFGGTSSDWGNSVQQTRDEGYIITGMIGEQSSTNGDICLIKTDSKGKAKTISSDTLWFERLFQRFPNAFLLLQQFIGY